MKKALIIILALVVLLGGGYLVYEKLSQTVDKNPIMTINPPEAAVTPGNTEDPSSEETVKTLAPDFTVKDRNGKDVNLSDLAGKGKPVVLNFWASWCPSCWEEMQTFEDAYLDLKDEVVFIMVDLVGANGETMEDGLAFVNEKGFTMPVYFDTQQTAATLYGIMYLPTTLFIDGQGYIVAGAQSALDKDTLYYGISLAQQAS